MIMARQIALRIAANKNGAPGRKISLSLEVKALKTDVITSGEMTIAIAAIEDKTP